MRKNINIKKGLCLLLSLLTIMSTFAGCSKEEEVEVEEIVPEIQIFEDSYERNEEITDMLTYRVDYITTNNKNSSSMDVRHLFNHTQIQVDNWDSVVVGATTMGELAAIIDQVNENYVTEKTNAVIAERQAIIDAEYEAAKEKAESKGKTYDKPKKEVRTDDIHFEEPYAYTVKLGKSSKATPEEYKPTLLVDSSKYATISFDVSKYGIPYVHFDFSRVKNIYNNEIVQEADWIMNGVSAADVSSYIVTEDSEDQNAETPDFVDADGLNKAAKQNIIMSGNIAFGGEGFTWDSLKMLCSALQLTPGKSKEGFKQSSDDNFTYYTIMFYTNPFEINPDVVNEEEVYIPCTRLIATFDPLSQVCINWTIDTYSGSISFSDRNHDLSDPTEVNAHEYQVDTNDYEGMRQTIKSWIKENALKTTTAYCAIDVETNEIFGTVDTGLTNLFVEPVINGVTYNCLDYHENSDGSFTGKYIGADDYAIADAMEDDKKANDYISEHTKTWKIACYLLNEDNNIIGIFTEDLTSMYVDAEMYYIADYESTETGYKNVRLLSNNIINQLLMVYTKTYKLNAEENNELQKIFSSTYNVFEVRDYVNELFADKEEAQKNQQSAEQENEDEDEIEKENIMYLPTDFIKTNINEDISTFKYNDIVFDMKTLTTNELNQNGVELTADPNAAESLDTYGLHSAIGHLSGIGDVLHVVEKNEDMTMRLLTTEADVFTFYNGLHVGMTKVDALAAIQTEGIEVLNDEIVLKNTKNTLLIWLLDETISEIALINNEAADLSDNWEDLDIAIDNVVYHYPYDYNKLKENGWVANDEIDNIIAPNAYGIATLYNDYYGDSFHNLFHISYGVYNANDSEANVTECMGYDMYLVRMDYDYVPNVFLSNGIHYGSTYNEIIDAFGDPYEIEENDGFGPQILLYQNDDSEINMTLTVDDEYGLTGIRLTRWIR